MGTTAMPRARRTGFLKAVQREGQKLPSRMIMQGIPGIGKTSWAAHCPGVLFGLPADETGLITLLDSGLVKDIPYMQPWETWDDVLDSVDELTAADHEYKALCIDGLSGVERLCHEHVCARDYGGKFSEQGFLGYMRGYETSLADWRILLGKLDRLRLTKRMTIIWLAHSKIATFKSPDTADYDRWVVDCHQKTWSLTSKWADIVMFATHHVETVKEGGRSKGRSAGDRLIYTTWTATYEAKNRHNLPEIIDMGSSGKEAWNNFAQAMKDGRKS